MGVIEGGRWISDEDYKHLKAKREKDPGAEKSYVDPRTDSGGGLGALAKRLHDAKAAPSASPSASPSARPAATPEATPKPEASNSAPDLSLEAFLARMAKRG